MPKNTKSRVVIFTAGSLQRDLELLIGRLQDSEHVELAGIVVDQWRRPWQRVRFLARRWGWGVFLVSVICRLVDRNYFEMLWRKWHNSWMPTTQQASFATLKASGLPVLFVENVNSKAAAKQISQVSPDLGVIVGGRILKSFITQIPRLGTLNIHKHDATKYRGSPQIGYPERKFDESHLGVTIHFATSKVDEGDIVSMISIPIEECDDDRSLAIKATVHGMQGYFEAILAVATGQYERQPQATNSGTTYITTPYVDRYRFWRPFRKRVAATFVRPGTTWLQRFTQEAYRQVRFAVCLATLPWLTRMRKRFEASGQAPIVVLYYHGVGNGGENWMTLPMHRLHEDIQYLQQHYKIISVEEAVQRLRSGVNHEMAAVLTFDDGYASCYENLAPYLNYYQVPGTIFCCPAASKDQSLHAHDENHGCVRARLMSQEELANVSSDYVTLGSHGNYHEDMGSLSGRDLEQAVVQSGVALEQMIGRPVSYFSFPFGKKHHMSAEALQQGAQRYEAMFSAYGGYNVPDQENRLHFQRIANPQSLTSLVSIMAGLHRKNPFYVDRPTEYGDKNLIQAAGMKRRSAA